MKEWEDSRWPITVGCLGLTGLVITKYVKVVSFHMPPSYPLCSSFSQLLSQAPWTRRWCWSQAAPRESASAWLSGWPPTPTKHSKVTKADTACYCTLYMLECLLKELALGQELLTTVWLQYVMWYWINQMTWHYNQRYYNQRFVRIRKITTHLKALWKLNQDMPLSGVCVLLQ